ncbi:MAG: M1 family aminopeptidase [Vicinamibacterales bacterium]
MQIRLWLIAGLAALLMPGPSPVAARDARPPQAQEDGVAHLVLRLEEVLQAGDVTRFHALLTPEARGSIHTFEALVRGPRTRAVVRERDRIPREDGSVDLLLNTFLERGPVGHIATWTAHAQPGQTGWVFTAISDLSSLDGLYRLSLGTQAFEARGLTITATDFTLHMRSGIAFATEAGGGVTGIVLRGNGEMTFTPEDPAERKQVEIFSGRPALRAAFDEAFVRLNPADLRARMGGAALVPRQSSPDEYRRALEVFEDLAHKTYRLDLQDLSRDRWSLIPAYRDVVAEVRTKRHDDLTYALSGAEAENVSLFQRATRRNMSVYPSASQVAARGRFYSEDDLADYDIEHQDVDVRMTPAREWIEGTARLRAKVRGAPMASMTLRLAESLVVRAVVAKGHGRLMHLRVVGQNNVIVTFPATLAPGEPIELEVHYGGRLPPQALDREVVALSAPQDLEPLVFPPDPRWIYSNRSYWYPQSTVPDFTTARLRVTVPQPLDVVATGIQTGAAEPVIDAPPAPPARAFTFESAKPIRYLSFVIGRFAPVVSRAIPGETPATLNVVASPRQVGRARAIADQAEQIFTYYRSLLGSAPYPQLTVAVSESDLPGGHSPAYFVLLNQPMLLGTVTWRNDPVSFESFPAFFIAHEIAHQWWGQAVGWKNYHEQWISEGFAQYFAALFAGEQRGPDAMASLMREMRTWALDKGDEGPIYLGYRLGHIKNDSRVFRAVVYNKSAIVLHMLRRLVGDERFFAGVRRFYEMARFGKAGTEDFRRVMESETGRNLERFFERWIYGFGVPAVKVTHRVETLPGGETELVIRAEQAAVVYDLPITIRIEQANRASREVLLLLTDTSAELRVPIDARAGRVRRVQVDSDGAALARFVR